ncbi:MAG: EamA family transporter, partial [Xanthomonadales bacterium]|nr:EamA family transporter [Xanthomonadales bacterium]
MPVGASFIAAVRLALSALMLVFVLRVLGRSLDLRRQWRAWLWLGTISAALPFLCFAYAARSLPAGYMAVINATVPLLTVIFAALLWRIRASWSKRIGVVVV